MSKNEKEEREQFNAILRYYGYSRKQLKKQLKTYLPKGK